MMMGWGGGVVWCEVSHQTAEFFALDILMAVYIHIVLCIGHHYVPFLAKFSANIQPKMPPSGGQCIVTLSWGGGGVGISQLLYKLDLRYFNGSLYTHSAMYWPPSCGQCIVTLSWGWGVGISQFLYKLDLRYFNGSLYTHSAMYWPPLGGIFGQNSAKNAT